MKGKKGWAICLAGFMTVLSTGCSGSMPWVEAAGETAEETGERTASDRLEAVKQSGEIRIGISADYAPFAFEMPEEGGERVFAGADIELGRYIGERLEVTAEFYEMEFEDCLAAVAEGSVDMVLLGMLPEADRDSVMDYTDVYYKPGEQAVLIKETQKEKLTELADFEQRTVAAQYGSLQAQVLAEQFPGSYPEFTENAKDAVFQLRLGQVDGVILEKALAEEAVKEYTDLAVSRVQVSYTPSGAVGIVGGVVKGEAKLLSEVNEILKDVCLENKYLKWLDEANEQAASLVRSTQ